MYSSGHQPCAEFSISQALKATSEAFADDVIEPEYLWLSGRVFESVKWRKDSLRNATAQS
jgi:hypothetical protein